MQLYVDLTAPLLGTDVIVWPESAVPALEETIRPFLQQVAGAANARGSSLIMGLLRHDATTGSYYNSIASWSTPDGSQRWYDKRRLVPFGEFFPVPAAVREWLRLMSLPYSDFQPGSDTQAPLRAAGQPLAPTVCYEDAYGVEQLRLARESTLLVNVTNDAWFGDSTAPHQHLDISRMRALESGSWVLSDRFVDSSLAYQGGAGGLGIETVREINAFAIAGCYPDRTLVLLLDEGTDRARARDVQGSDRIGGRGDDYHRRVDAAFRIIAAEEPERVQLIDASGAPGEVTRRLLEAIEDLLP